MIELRNVRKSFGSRVVLDGISLSVDRGEFMVIIGPSGCGKTTTIKTINRLIDIDEGDILIDGKSIYRMDPIQLRMKIGYVIQQIGLFPNMTIEENISVVPKLMKWDRTKIRNRCKELLDMVGMPFEQYRGKYPKQLSGGQQQRVGVLRALAANPPIIIMDEPLGALDPITRQILQKEIKKIQQQFDVSIIFITHDMREALMLADRIVFMNEGKILQVDTPENLLMHPKDKIISQFMQMQNITGKDIVHRVKDFMKHRLPDPHTAEVIDEKADLHEAISLFRKSRSDCLGVRNREGRIIGSLSMMDVLDFFAGDSL